MYIDINFLLNDMFYDPKTNGLSEAEAIDDKDMNRAINRASDTINIMSGGAIDKLGIEEVGEFAKRNIQKATGHLAIHYLTNGLDWLRGQASTAGAGGSFSQSHPSEPEYIPQIVKELLQQAGYYTPMIGISNSTNAKEKHHSQTEDYLPEETGFARHLTLDEFNRVGVRRDKLISSDNSILFKNTDEPNYNDGGGVLDLNANLDHIAELAVEQEGFQENVRQTIQMYLTHPLVIDNITDLVYKEIYSPLKTDLVLEVPRDEVFITEVKLWFAVWLSTSESIKEAISRLIEQIISADEQWLKEFVELISPKIVDDEVFQELIANNKDLINKVVETVVPVMAKQLEATFKELSLNQEFEELWPVFEGNYDLNDIKSRTLVKEEYTPFIEEWKKVNLTEEQPSLKQWFADNNIEVKNIDRIFTYVKNTSDKNAVNNAMYHYLTNEDKWVVNMTTGTTNQERRTWEEMDALLIQYNEYCMFMSQENMVKLHKVILKKYNLPYEEGYVKTLWQTNSSTGWIDWLDKIGLNFKLQPRYIDEHSFYKGISELILVFPSKEASYNGK